MLTIINSFTKKKYPSGANANGRDVFACLVKVDDLELIKCDATNKCFGKHIVLMCAN